MYNNRLFCLNFYKITNIKTYDMKYKHLYQLNAFILYLH